MYNPDISFDPYKTSFLSPDVRRKIIEFNVNQTKIGMFKDYPKTRSLVYTYNERFNTNIISNICDVSVVYEHSIDVVGNLVEHGVNSNIKNPLPVVLNLVGKEFSGTNYESGEGIRDEMIYLRTNFNVTMGISPPYPIKDGECVYSQFVTTIRPKYPKSFLTHDNTFRFSMITTAPINKPKINSDGNMDVVNFIRTCCTIESVFQMAIAARHTSLILCPYGHFIDDNPLNDIISIYNYCVMKYGHKFIQIIFAIPPYYPKEQIFDIYNGNIIRPTNLVNEIDIKYDKRSITKALVSQNILDDEEKLKKMEELKKLEELKQ